MGKEGALYAITIGGILNMNSQTAIISIVIEYSISKNRKRIKDVADSLTRSLLNAIIFFKLSRNCGAEWRSAIRVRKLDSLSDIQQISLF